MFKLTNKSVLILLHRVLMNLTYYIKLTDDSKFGSHRHLSLLLLLVLRLNFVVSSLSLSLFHLYNK